MHHFWVVARGGEVDGAVGLLGLDGMPTGEHLHYRGDDVTDVPYVVTAETTTLPDGRPAYIAEREGDRRR
ncbi:hypothetical protein ACPPVS_10080 [Cellulomonas sp. McL0617]|uniref:hypothetical protein n=1 Tax=Cellulomonas sp. McL0617 TaxID=3415675 RepID=UPI003CE6CACD